MEGFCCEHYVKGEAFGARQLHPAARKRNWDFGFKVVMPGKAGKQLFEEYPLSDQSVVARAHGREGGLAGKGTPKSGGSAKGMPNTGRAAKGVMNTREEFLLAFQQEVSTL
jgi:hypothetical protein